MKRKVTQMGQSSLVITLPSKWVREYQVKKGQEVEVTAEKGTLTVGLSPAEKEKKTLVIDLSETEEFMRRQITVPYMQGYDEIQVLHASPKAVEMIEWTLNNLIGFEIIDMDRDSCTIKNVSAEIEGEFEAMLRKLFLTILLMGERCVEYLREGNAEGNAGELEKNLEAERLSNKYTYFCERVMHNKRSDINHPLFVFTIAFSLEGAADYLRDISTGLLKTRKKIPPEVKKDVSDVVQLYRAYYEHYYSRTPAGALAIRAREKRIRERIEKSVMEGRNHFLYLYLMPLLSMVDHLNQITVA